MDLLTGFPTYYRRLNDYFPAQELKHPGHLNSLVNHHPLYHLKEQEDYLLLYAAFPDFIFVDYLLVEAQTRGKGVGSQVLRTLQQKDRPIILEVEQPEPQQPDTVRRRRFYQRHGFIQANGVHYERIDENGDPFIMDILYWSPTGRLKDKTVLHMMATVCDEIHNHRADVYYEAPPAPVDQVLSLVQ